MAVKIFKKLWAFCLVMGVLIFITSKFAATISTNVLTISVGIVIVLFVITNVFLKKFAIPDNHDKAYQIGFGAVAGVMGGLTSCLLYTSPSPRDRQKSRMPSSA